MGQASKRKWLKRAVRELATTTQAVDGEVRLEAEDVANKARLMMHINPWTTWWAHDRQSRRKRQGEFATALREAYASPPPRDIVAGAADV